MSTADKQIVLTVAPAQPTGPAWTSNVPTINFTNGVVASYDLKQHTSNFSTTNNIMARVAGTFPSGVSMTTLGVINYNGSGAVANASGLQFDIQPAGTIIPSGFTLVATGRTGPQYFGANAHLGQLGYGNVAAISAREREMNMRVIRDGPNWDAVELSPGVHSFNPTGTAPYNDVFASFADHAAAGHDIFFNFLIPYFINPLYTTDLTNPAFRARIVAYAVSVLNAWLGAGRPANRFIIGLGNEINEPTFGEYGIDWNDGNGVQNYGALCKEVRTALRAINPAIRVQIGEGVNGSHSLYAAWTASLKATPNFWSQALDIFSTHEYHEPFPTMPIPETLYARLVPWAQTIMTDAGANGRPDITIAMSEGGYSPTFSGSPVSDAEITRRYSRLPFLYSVVPGLEFLSIYAVHDNTPEGFGLTPVSGASLNANRALAIRDAFLHVNMATGRRKWDGVNGDVAVGMDVSAANGGQRVALWNLTGRTLTGLQCVANQAGTLRIQTIAGATTTTPLVAGQNTVPAIALNDTAKVLHTTDGTVISFGL